ncbi:hypothetical protein ABIC03_001988 [Bradyrhizobium sp. RT6a]|uniref:hypothetical protein n=1 Tax=Bradyrhizobium sp. RT6a TaxID=3156381 RepID=UPI0033981E4F
MRNLIIVALVAQILACYPLPVSAGGTCILHPQAFKLQSDTVQWLMKIKPGAECIQGLRWSTIMIDAITVVDPPKSGRLVLQGPSFRYFSAPAAQGADHFKIAITGTSLHIGGTSSIEVDVVSH